MGKMERKCSWRPLICPGLRALMKPLLPGCRPLPLRLWWHTGQSRRGRQCRTCCREPFSSTARMTGVKRTGFTELWKGACLPKALLLWSPAMPHSRVVAARTWELRWNEPTSVFERESSRLNGEGKSCSRRYSTTE